MLFRIAPDMEHAKLLLYRLEHAFAILAGLILIATRPIALALLNAPTVVFATRRFSPFPSAPTVQLGGWDLPVLIHAPSACKCHQTAVIASARMAAILAVAARLCAAVMEHATTACARVKQHGVALIAQWLAVPVSVLPAPDMVPATLEPNSASATADGLMKAAPPQTAPAHLTVRVAEPVMARWPLLDARIALLAGWALAAQMFA